MRDYVSFLNELNTHHLVDLAELESHHSEELFRTIQTGNPYLAEIRSQFISTAKMINDQLEK